MVPRIIQDKDLFWYYICVVWVPVYFIGYSVLHILIHNRDGQEGGKIRYSRTYKLKQIVLAFLVTVCMVNAIIEVSFICLHVYEDTGDFIRPAYYIFAALAWSLCFYLVRFDFKRRLKMGRFGQRVFWVMSGPLFIVDIFLMNQDYGTSDLEVGLRIGFYTLSAIFVSWLAFIAFYRPDDFGNKPETVYEPLASLLIESDHAPSFSELQTQVEILDYKIKMEGSKAVVFYNIQVVICASRYVIKRTSAAIEDLGKLLKDHLGVLRIQGLEIPQFPEPTYRESSMHKIIEDLEVFLKEASKPVCMLDGVCDFFEIPPQYRDSIRAEQKSLQEFFRQTSSVQFSMPESGSTEFASIVHREPQMFFLVSIPNYARIGDHFEYSIHWQFVKSGLLGKCTYRYNEMRKFNSMLKSSLGNVELPEFPSKNLMSFILHEPKSEALTQRSSSLAKYYEALMNDPAYTCEALLKFMNCDIPLDVIWSPRLHGDILQLSGPMSWEQHLDIEPKPYVNYSFTVVKYQDSRLVNSWTLSRRYNEFKDLHAGLRARCASPMLKRYLKYLKIDSSVSKQVPAIPKKSFKMLQDPKQIEVRKDDLQRFLEKCFVLRHILDSHCFRVFIEEPKL